jgi:hypothetical protein
MSHGVAFIEPPAADDRAQAESSFAILQAEIVRALAVPKEYLGDSIGRRSRVEALFVARLIRLD